MMHAYGFSPAQFTHLVACYGIAAALSGFAGGFVLDRFDRKRALLVLYAGFGPAKLSCGQAPNHRVLLLARLAAGAFGGLASSMVTAMTAVTLAIIRLGPSSLAFASLMLGLFMVSMSGRYAPAMTMITYAVEARYRGGFMSINSALQLAANGIANLIAGFFVSEDANGHLRGLPMVSYVACGFLALTVLFALELRAAAPHVARVNAAGRSAAKATA